VSECKREKGREFNRRESGKNRGGGHGKMEAFRKNKLRRAKGRNKRGGLFVIL